MIGVLAGFNGQIAIAGAIAKQVRLVGITVGSHVHQRRFLEAVEAARIRPVIDRRFALVEAAAAFEYCMSGAHVGKICLEW